jgi:uncharacterized protein involved in exopolysaccharide biosynthesis
MNKEFVIQNRSANSVGTETGFNVDYKRVLYHIFKYWYLVVLSLLVFVAVAFIRNRYATRVIPITASIIIKEAEESAEGKLLYNNPLVNFYRNYLNELYIVKSHPLIQATIKDLHFQVAFYNEGNILTTENYYDMPVRGKVLFEQNGARPFSAYFQVISKDEFKIFPLEGEEITFAGTYQYGDTIKIGASSYMFEKDGIITDAFLNQQYILRYVPSSTLASMYIGRLEAEWAEEGAGVINLSINGSIPQKEMDFLNALINRYEEYNLNKKSLAATRSIAFISEQLEGITDSLKAVERQLERFKNQNVVTDLNSEALRLYEKAEGIESQKSELIIRANYYKYLQDYLQQGKNLDQIILPSSVGISDPILAGLISKMIDFQMDMKMHISTEKRDNPLVVEQRRRIAEIKRDVIESINNQESVDKIKLNFLNKALTDIEKQLDFPACRGAAIDFNKEELQSAR